MGRLVTTILLLAVLGFCVFGFVATFEPLNLRDRVVWRTVYALAGLAISLGLVRLLRCQCRQFLKWCTGKRADTNGTP